MTGCDRVQPLLAEWVTNELDGVDAADVRSHLAECAACRADEAEMREVLSVLDAEKSPDGLGGVKDPGAPYWAGFASRVSASVAAKPRAKKAPAATNVVSLFSRVPRFAAAALAAAALVVLAVNMPRTATVSDPDAQLAALLASPGAEGIGDAFVPSASDAMAGLATDDLARLGERLVGEEDGADLDDLSSDQLDELLELLET